jgi:hypothetical protein
VLNYSQERQFDLLRAIGFSSPAWEDLSYLLIGIVVAASLAGAAWTRLERQRSDPWLRLLARARLHLQGSGLAFEANSPARSMALQLTRQRKDAKAQAFCDWLLRMEAQRYAAAAGPSTSLATLQRELQQLIQAP